jgi:hypothetical protein
MNFARRLLLFSFVSFIFSCTHEESNETITIIENLSSQQITVTPYDNGMALTSDIHTIEPSKKKVVQQGSARGKGNSFLYSDDIQVMDSVVINFGRDVSSTHYSYSVVGSNSKAIKRDNPRSLFNRDSYKRVILSETKYALVNEFTYTFTVQDYLDAAK